MAGRKEIIRNSVLAGFMLSGGIKSSDVFAAADYSNLSSNSSYNLEMTTPMPSQGENDCYLLENPSNEENMFKVGDHVIGGPVSIQGERLWTTNPQDPSIIVFDGAQYTDEEVQGWPMQIPSGMTATVVVHHEGEEKVFDVVGGNSARICDEYLVKKMTLDTMAENYDPLYAGFWKEEDTPHWTPVGIEWSEEAAPEPSATVAPTPVLTESASPEATTSSEMDLTEKQQELVHVTAEHLVTIYGSSMSQEHYPDEQAKYEFFAEVARMGIRLNPDNPNIANQITAVMYFETAGSFAPDQQNQQGSDAVGLIQFMGSTAESMGVSTEQLSQMTPIEQLVYVERFLADRQAETGVKIRTLNDAYLAVFWPAAMGKGGDYVLFENGSDPYTYNGAVLDKNGDGIVTSDETTETVLQRALGQSESWQYLVTDGTAETMPTVEKQLEIVKADRKTMQAIADANTDLYGNASPQYLCLQGVRLSIAQVLPEMNDPLLVGSAYLTNDIFAAHSDRFAQLQITDENQLYNLPSGAILVYPRNNHSKYDYAAGAHHGHISIIIGEDGNGEMIAGSDHHTYLDTDLENLEGMPTVWVPIVGESQPEPTQTPEAVTQTPQNEAGGSSASSAELTSSEQLAISYGYGVEPPYYPETLEDYQSALESEFGVFLVGFDDIKQYEWAWEVLWSTSNTNFPHLVEGMIYTKKGVDGDFSEQVQCGWNGQPDVKFAPYGDEVQFKNLFIHEAGHFIHCREWLMTEGDLLNEMQRIIEQEGAISAYGASDGRNENFADMIMYALNPADGFVSVGEGSPSNPIYDGSKPMHTEFVMDILFGPLDTLPVAPEPVAQEGTPTPETTEVPVPSATPIVESPATSTPEGTSVPIATPLATPVT